jgi:acetolactate synthase-1/2/3 large subunit
MIERMTGAAFLARTLHGYGVGHVFFVEAILRSALREMEALGIRRILTHGEKAAAYMADGYARMRRGPGICMAQSVGAANLAAGLQEPFLGGSPVIALTGCQRPTARYRNAYQEILHGPLYAPVTKFHGAVETLEQFPLLLAQAFREAVSGAPGPVHLDLSGHTGQRIEGAEADLEVRVEPAYKQFPAQRIAPEERLLREAARLLREARRPVIVAGGGVTASGAGAEVVTLAERLSIPVATSLTGKETLLEQHPLNLGVVGRYSRWCANRVVSEADLVLFIGSGTGDLVTHDWTIPPAGTAVIQIDIDPSELGRSYAGAIGILGDARLAVQGLLGVVAPSDASRAWAEHARQVVQRWREEVEPLRTSDQVPIRPERLCREVTECLPPDGVVVADTGFAAIWTGTMVHLTRPTQRYLRCAGSLGWALPASLGVKCAAPERAVICFTGDGGFWYHLAELETACRCGIHTVTVVNNNFALGQCVGSVRRLYAGHPGNPDDLCKFSRASLAAIASEMGCLGIRVEAPGEIVPALRRALAAERPAVVEVITDLECPAPAPWSP